VITNVKFVTHLTTGNTYRIFPLTITITRQLVIHTKTAFVTVIFMHVKIIVIWYYSSFALFCPDVLHKSFINWNTAMIFLHRDLTKKVYFESDFLSICYYSQGTFLLYLYKLTSCKWRARLMKFGTNIDNPHKWPQKNSEHRRSLFTQVIRLWTFENGKIIFFKVE